jgi:hypothetical protein
VDDGSGGTIILAATAPVQSGEAVPSGPSSTGVSAAIAGQDTFVFPLNSGPLTIANFAPATDSMQFSKSVFANIAALLGETHDDGLGNAVINVSGHDTITLQHVTIAQLLAYQSDFHFV